MTPIRKLEAAVVDALEDVKAKDIRVYDVAHLSSLFDRVVIASAESNRQLRALANSVREKTKAAGGRIVGVEGEESGEWVLVDLGDIVVHIMQPAVRVHYNLEELWDQPKPRPARGTAARAKRPAGTRKARKPA
ncbi:MAG TPA: ribosome silencing factor [Burkholderiales bacterium]